MRDHYWTAASDECGPRGAAPADRSRACTPNGSVHVGPLVWPDGKLNSTGPAEVRGEVAQHVADGRIAARLVAPGKLAEDDGARVREARPPARAASASDGCGTDARRCLRGTGRNPRAASNAHGVPSDATSCVSVPPTSTPAPRRPQRLELRRPQLARRLRRHHHVAERGLVDTPRPLRQPPVDHRAVNGGQAVAAGRTHSSAVMSL